MNRFAVPTADRSGDEPNQPQVVLVEINHRTQTVRLLRSDLKELEVPLPAPMPIPRVVRTSYSPSQPGIVMTCDNDTLIVVETPGDSATTDTRPVAYLDQNQWSTIAKCLHDPDSQSPEDVAAARQVSEWCDQQRLRLPVSMAHLLETTYWTNRRQREFLALTLLRLGRGWQMRHPLDVRRDEFAAHLEGRPPVVHDDVFTSSPAALHQRDNRLVPTAPTDFPEVMAQQYTALSAASVLTSTVLDPESSPRGANAHWERVHQQVSNAVDRCAAHGDKKTLVDQVLLMDLGSGLVQVAQGLSPAYELPDPALPTAFWTALSSCRSIMTYRQLCLAKHLDRGSRWNTTI